VILMKKPVILFLLLTAVPPALHAGGLLQRGKVQMICHRTANRDEPENTLESLALAARMGCNIVEVDVRRTLDGQLVLNHDDFLERLTSGMGNVELTSYDELQLLDAGAWMGQRFMGMRIPRFEEALRVAREQGIGLMLDIKSIGIGPQILAMLQREGMLERVIFGGEWNDIPPLYPDANKEPAAYVNPGVTATEVARFQRQGKFVVANFSANAHEMGLPSMRAAVAAGVDAINVDYPRLGADAVGRPVEAKIAALSLTASTGSVETRTAAIRELSYYTGFPTQHLFMRWLHDDNARVSRAAAVALVTARPAAPPQVFVDALSAPENTARQNAAWALGILKAPATKDLLSLLSSEKMPSVVQEILLALSRCPGEVPAEALLPFFKHEVLPVRGATALALARHQPEIAARAIPDLLAQEEKAAAVDYENYVRRGKPKLTQEEIEPITQAYREQMKLIQALEFLSPADATSSLATQAFRWIADYSLVTALVSGYQLWDHIALDPSPAIAALASKDTVVADRAEWTLVKAGTAVLPAVRSALPAAIPAVRERLVRILAWQEDEGALSLLGEQGRLHPEESELIHWAIEKIQIFAMAGKTTP
jgi:glycerophosphoryl diester phosphodiesterase